MNQPGMTYVAFDADTDMRYYQLLKAWRNHPAHPFNFSNAHELNRIMRWSNEYTIKKKLRKRLLQSEIFVLLIGERTKFLYKYVRWEINQALKMELPIICVN